MASGDTLLTISPLQASFPSSNPATPDSRNTHPVLDFDTTTQETVYFANLIMPRHYAGGNIIAYVHHAASSATSGTIGWGITFERVGTAQDLDSDGFATEKIITAATVSGTAGIITVSNATLTAGATDTDSVAAGEAFRIRLRRDVANDTATGDAEFYALELKEA